MKTLKRQTNPSVAVNDGPGLTVGWFAVPHAGQEDANDGFILFTTDRDNPSAGGSATLPNAKTST